MLLHGGHKTAETVAQEAALAATTVDLAKPVDRARLVLETMAAKVSRPLVVVRAVVLVA
tara:strand:+ start:336 stop:512 length:177 start_codon:yes stop_codon:yes gene_type:complete